MTTRRPTGVIVPIITPFTASGDVDTAAVGRITDYLADGGVDSLFLAGTTGEGASMTARQKHDLVAAAVKAVRGRMGLYAGISSNVLAEAVRAAHEYADLGVDGLFALPPDFYPIPDAALEDWFRQLLDQVPLDLLLYNIPMTTHMSIPMALVDRLANHPRLLGLKDSEPLRDRLIASVAIARRRPGFHALVGTNKMYIEGLALGADGIIPSSANLEPRLHCDLYRAVKAGRETDVQRLKAAMDEVLAQYNGPTLGESLAKLKALMATKGLCEPHVLPPLRRWVA